MASQADKADALVAQAKKKIASWGFFSGSSKYEDAAEIFAKAANLYKAAKKCAHCRTVAPSAGILSAHCLRVPASPPTSH